VAASEPHVTGRVTVSVTVAAPVAQIWDALTRREVVRRWFGELSTSLRPGVEARLDFGDGDFFAITDVHVAAPSHLRYTWRFLGTGPANQISWRVEDREGYRVVTVTDDEPFRSTKEVGELTPGWTDFLDRLATYLSTGNTTRYDWRRDFEGSIELHASAAAAVRTLFATDSLQKWLPFGGAVPGERATALLCDGQYPERFATSRLDASEPSRIRFELIGAGWLGPTYCRLTIAPHGNHAILDVRHTGWEGISDDNAYCMSQRRRFGDHWIAALHTAVELVQQEPAAISV